MLRLLRLLSAAALLVPSAAVAAAGDDWITVNKNYDSQRYVDLHQITTDNVKDLKELCEIDLNEASSFSSGILKIDRTLYVTTRRMTYAIDATSCKLRWRTQIDEQPMNTNNNRGAGYWNGKLFRGTPSGHLVALDAASGKVLWNVPYPGVGKTDSTVAAPIAWNGIVFIGITTADIGARGQVSAFDANTGHMLWTHFTVPAGKLKYKGGAFWTTFSLDTANGGTLYASASNPFIDYNGNLRPGPNLETNTVLALDARSGNLNNRYYQAVPHDVHDWDLGTAATLYSIDSHERLSVAGKDGIVYGVDRASMKPVFQTPGTSLLNGAAPFPFNLTKELDRPQNAVRVCPGSIGGAQFTGTSYAPGLRTLYVGMNDFCWFYFNANGLGITQPDLSLGHPPQGWVTAMDAASGEVLWRYHAPAQVQAGTVPTAGGVVFAGDTLGDLMALDARTGKLLKNIDAQGALNDGLISYAVDNVQYVAADVGGVTMNPPGITTPLRVGGPLRVKLYTLNAKPVANVKLDRVPFLLGGQQLYTAICSACHGPSGIGVTYPSIRRQVTVLTDADRLKHFFETVTPPMPKVYPGLLNDDDVAMLVDYFKSLKLTPDPQYVPSASSGTPDWQQMYKVMTFPRCINCHTMTNFPRQADDRHPHHFNVVRGPSTGPDAGFGSIVARCSSCHGESNNDKLGIPGAPDWHLAPPSMAWESAPNVAMTGHQLCTMLKDPKRNGGRDLMGLLVHVQAPDSLVTWAFDPGKDLYGHERSKPPLTYDQFVDAFRGWVNAGGPCPQ